MFCGSQLEDAWKVFFTCHCASECWDKAGLKDKLEVIILNADNLLEFMFAMLGEPDRNAAAIFGMVAWQIWKERNSMLWDNVCRSPTDAVYAAGPLLAEWMQARRHGRSPWLRRRLRQHVLHGTLLLSIGQN